MHRYSGQAPSGPPIDLVNTGSASSSLAALDTLRSLAQTGGRGPDLRDRLSGL